MRNLAFGRCLVYVGPIVWTKLSLNGLSKRYRPMRTIFPSKVISADGSCGASKISKTSRTPWTILISPVERGSFPFNLWISRLLLSVSLESMLVPESGSFVSQRIDLSHASRFGNCSGVKTGTKIVTVVMDWKSLVPVEERKSQYWQGPNDCVLSLPHRGSLHRHTHGGLAESLRAEAPDLARSHGALPIR